MNAQKANLLRAEIIQNIREGNRPQSLAEKREIEEERKLQETEARKEQEAAAVTFDELAQEFHI